MLAAGLAVAGLVAARQEAFGVVGYLNVILTNGYHFPLWQMLGEIFAGLLCE